MLYHCDIGEQSCWKENNIVRQHLHQEWAADPSFDASPSRLAENRPQVQF